MTSQVAILARKAEIGKGKRRLAASVGDEEAYRIYCELIRITADAVQKSKLPATVFFDPIPGDEAVWPKDHYDHDVQVQSTNLGDRMRSALGLVLAKAEAQNNGAIVIGTDCPSLTKEHLHAAAKALENHDAVMGPTEDGGYYLLGVKYPHRALFSNVEWSTIRVADQTRAAFKALGFTWAELPVLNDIDEEEDWLAYAKTISTMNDEIVVVEKLS